MECSLMRDAWYVMRGITHHVSRYHDQPRSLQYASYAAASIRPASSPASLSINLTIQPLPYGSLFTDSGASDRPSFTAVIVPLAGKFISDAALTDSIEPNAAPCLNSAPTSGSST